MSVYIQSMEMPSCCMFCPVSNSVGCGLANPPIIMTSKEMLAGRPDWCPLIEVPEPHGRLIDAGRFDARLDRGKRTISSLPLPEDFIDMYALIADGVKEELMKCGTIIPEEGDPR